MTSEINITPARKSPANSPSVITHKNNTPKTEILKSNTVTSKSSPAKVNAKQGIKSTTFFSIRNEIKALIKSPVPENLRKDLSNFLKAFESVSIVDRESLAVQLSYKVLNSGMFFEKRIEELISELLLSDSSSPAFESFLNSSLNSLFSVDMKSLLLKVLEYFKDKKNFKEKSLKTLYSKLEKSCKEILKFIEKEQQRVVNSGTRDDPLLLFIVPWQGSNRPMYLRMILMGRSRQKKQHYTVFDFLIYLNHMGSVRGTLVYTETVHMLNLFTEDDRAREFITKRIDALSLALKHYMSDVVCNVRTDTRSISEFFEKGDNIPFKQSLDVRV